MKTDSSNSDSNILLIFLSFAIWALVFCMKFIWGNPSLESTRIHEIQSSSNGMSSAAQIAKLIDEFPSDAALEAYKLRPCNHTYDM